MGTSALHTPAYRQLCKKLLQWRQDAGLTQRQLGAKLQKPHTYVHKTETGERRIDPIEFIRWCKGCGVDPAKSFKKLL